VLQLLGVGRCLTVALFLSFVLSSCFFVFLGFPFCLFIIIFKTSVCIWIPPCLTVTGTVYLLHFNNPETSEFFTNPFFLFL